MVLMLSRHVVEFSILDFMTKVQGSIFTETLRFCQERYPELKFTIQFYNARNRSSENANNSNPSPVHKKVF